jgi:hypothetical protein
MTDAKLKTAPSQGHGLVDRITDVHFASASKGEKPEDLVCVVVLRRSGIGQQETANGMHRSVQYEAVRLEPVLDPNQAGELRYLGQALWEQRHSNGQQKMLPLGIPGQANEERRVALLERIDDWAEEESLSGGQLEAKWREHFGIGDGQDFSYGDRGVPGDYRKSEVAWLMQFALTVGALGNDEPSADLVEAVIEGSGDENGDGEQPDGEDEPGDGDAPPAVMVDEIGNNVDGDNVTPIGKPAKKTAAAKPARS